MGTSGSKPDGRKGSPLIPPWADQDPPRPDPPPPPDNGDPDPLPKPPPPAPPPPPENVSPEGRYRDFRVAYGNFARTGSTQSAREALGHHARTSAGGGRTAAARTARAARSGGGALASFAASATTGQAPVSGFNIRSLAGQSIDSAIAQIVDAFCPPGILDEEMARIAMGEALAVALEGVDTFDPDAVDAEAVRIATLTFVSELVFLEVASDGGNALAQAPSQTSAVQRELDLRDLIREVADDVGTPILTASSLLTAADFTRLVTRLVELVNRELAKW